MKTVKQMVAEIEASKAEYVTYGGGDIGIAVKREDAILDIGAMDDIQIGEGTWYECDKDGTLLSTLAARTLGSKGGQAKSEAKKAASRENGKKGGRPKNIA